MTLSVFKFSSDLDSLAPVSGTLGFPILYFSDLFLYIFQPKLGVF
jgi:hypothetical protein